MGILWLIVFGIVVGAVARWIVPGTSPGGVLGDLVVGIAGSIIGGWIFGIFGHGGMTGLGAFVSALIGAVVLLWVIRQVSGRKAA